MKASGNSKTRTPRPRALRIGYLGSAPVTFGHRAAQLAAQQGLFDGKSKRKEFISRPEHKDICEGVCERKFDFGVVAIENSVDGIIKEVVLTLENLAGRQVRVCGEVVVPVEHYLMNQSGNLRDVRTIVSHASALQQCKGSLARLLAKLGAGISVTYVASTGQAAQDAYDSPSVAAIASADAMGHYHLKPIRHQVNGERESFEDYTDNKTRFWVLSNEYPAPTGRDKTCLLLNLERDTPGSLWEALGFFARKRISLRVLYPCPIPHRNWEYTWVAEFDGHIGDPKFREAYEELVENRQLSISPPIILGAYPQAKSRKKERPKKRPKPR